MTDPRQTPIHEAATALDKMARISDRKQAAKVAALSRLETKYRAQMDAVLEELSPEALDLVKAQMGSDTARAAAE